MLTVIVARLRAAGCVYAEDEAALLIEAAQTPIELEAMVVRRVAGLPLEQVLGWAEFCGLRIGVEADVFVPRRRTGLLVREAVLVASANPVILDLCCGSGAVGAALASRLIRTELYAADLHPAAVRCATRNLTSYDGQVFEGDLYGPLPPSLRGRVDLLVVNAPYVPTQAIALMPPEARDHEPHVTLDGGPDGLDLHRRVIAEAPDWLSPAGHLLVETSLRQAPHTAQLMMDAGLTARLVTDDALDGTVAVGTSDR
jgi:release factor glutamine methyltransferase